MRVPGCGWLENPIDYPAMKAVALTAHFDGEKVQFDEPCQLDANARLVVVVLPPDDERQAWSRFSAGQLAKAYGDNEPEYTAADLRS
jgi:hypothetical protein